MALKRVPFTVQVPGELVDLMNKRVAEEHYASVSAYFVGLLLFDLSSRCRHWLTSQVMSEPPEILDKVVEEIIRDFPKQPRRGGGWFRGRVKEIIDQQKDLPS